MITTTIRNGARGVVIVVATSLAAASLEAQRPAGPKRPAGAAPVAAPPNGAAGSAAKPTVEPGVGRGRYRVTLTGFSVHSETFDDPLQVDGKRDEVYVSAEVALLDRNRKTLEPGSQAVRSKVLGDVGGALGGTNGHNGRIQAGSASPQGGLRTGDDYPKTPWRRHSAPSADAIPLAIWEGPLAQGENAVLITPTIWEYDQPDARAAFQWWAAWNGRATEMLLGSPEFMALLATLTGPQAPATLTGMAVVQKVELSLISELGTMADRPIGMVATADAKSGEKRFSFTPTTIVLNYDTAERLLAQNVGGKGPGVISVPYRENDAKLGGNYTLYLLVERLP